MNTAYKVFEVIDREILIPSKAQKINVSTDVNAEKLVLKMPQFYGDLDLTTLDIVMYIQGADISDIVAIRGYEVQGGFIVWEFVPQGAMLSKDGYINIQISGIKIETGTMSVKWQSKIKENAFYINRSMTGIVDSQVTPLPTELEQYRAEIIALISSVNLNRVVMDVTADTENVIVLHRGDGTQSPVHLTVSGGLTPTDLSNAIDNHNVGVNTHANIRKAIIDGDKAIDDKVSILSIEKINLQGREKIFKIANINTAKGTSTLSFYITSGQGTINNALCIISNTLNNGVKSVNGIVNVLNVGTGSNRILGDITINSLTGDVFYHSRIYQDYPNIRVLSGYDYTLHNEIVTNGGDYTVPTSTIATTEKIDILSDKVNWKPNGWKTELDPPSAFDNMSSTIFRGTSTFGGMTDPVIVKTDKLSDNVAKQEIFRTDTDKLLKYRLAYAPNKWGEWQTIATTDKVDILLTEFTGYRITRQGSYCINNVVYIDVDIETSNGANFQNFDQKTLVRIPQTFKPKTGQIKALSSCRNSDGNTPMSNENCNIWYVSGDIWCPNKNASNVKTINICGSYII